MASFDDLARWYGPLERWLAGGVMRRARLALLDELRKPERILLIGEGPGALVGELARRFPEARLTCMDVSAKMIEEGRARWVRETGGERKGGRGAGFGRSLLTPALSSRGEGDRFSMVDRKECDSGSGVSENGDRANCDPSQCEWIQGDVRNEVIPGSSWDLVVTSFVLDCFTEEEMAVVVPKLSAGLRTGGEWLQVDFQIPKGGGFRAWRASAIVWMLYRFFRATAGLSAGRLVPPQPFFERVGLTRVAGQERDWGLVYAEIWQKPGAANQVSAGASAADC